MKNSSTPDPAYNKHPSTTSSFFSIFLLCPVYIFTVRNSSCGKVMFSQSCIIHSCQWGGLCAWQAAGKHVWQSLGGCGRGARMGGGMCGRWQGVHGKGGGGHAWCGGSMCGGGGYAWQGGSVCGREACMAGGACMARETATAADGTHPTGMHSCQKCFPYSRRNCTKSCSQRVKWCLTFERTLLVVTG